MRIAVLADIHGNLQAFEAGLKHAHQQGYDQLVIAGDIVSGPDSLACWELACSLQVPLLRGNHERYIFDMGTPNADPLWSTEQFAPLQWASSQFSQQQRDAMRALPLELRLSDRSDLLLVHASQRSDNDSLNQHTPEELLEAYFPDPKAQLIVRAHNHVCATRLWGERIIATTGSIGLPLDSHPSAHYSIFEYTNGWKIQSFSVPYDLDAALERFQSSGYLAASGPMGELFRREVATASFYAVPFLRSYKRWSQNEPISLQQAVERFLALS